MTVINVDKDLSACTMVVTSEFDAPVDLVWQLWANPRLLERWWGPPTYPATVTEHDLKAGGKVKYFMTGPEGETPGGYWDVLEVDPPKSLLLQDGFADAEGNANDDLPKTKFRVDISEAGDKTRMLISSTYGSTEAMEQLLSMGMEEGLTEAMGQIDPLLEELKASA